MTRNFAKPMRFRDEQSTEELTWKNFKQVARKPLQRMSRVAGKSLIDPRKRAGMVLYKRKRF